MASIALLQMPAHGQKFIKKCTDIFEFDVGKNRHYVHEDSTLFISKMVMAPILRYEPATNLGIGIGAKLLFKPRGVSPSTRTSNMPLSVSYTLNNQFIFYSGFTVFFDREQYLLKGRARYSKFPIKYFGLGPESASSDALELSYENFLFEPILFKSVGDKGLFLGGGVRYNAYWNVDFLNEKDIDIESPLLDSFATRSVGIQIAMTFDNRDNVLNAQEGRLIEFNHGFYGTVAGGTNRFMFSKLDYREYLKPFAGREDILACQIYARFSWQDVPLLELSRLGGPERLRGFQEGRYRDRYALFSQAEYRWQALKRLGFVFFGGLGQVTDDLADWNWDTVKYSLGSGIRLKIIPSENLNIRFDYAFGMGIENDNNFYLGIAEAF